MPYAASPEPPTSRRPLPPGRPRPVRRRLPRAVPLAPVPVLPLLLLAAPPVSAADGWTAEPSGGGRPTVYAEGEPGSVLGDAVSVTNRSAGPVTVRLTGTGLKLGFAERRVRVPARTRAEVPFTLTVPEDAAPGRRTGTLTVRDTDGRTAAVLLRLRIAGSRLAALTVEHVAVRHGEIAYELVNRGTTPLVPRLTVRAEGVLGRVLDRAPRTLSVTLPPGSRTRLSEPWPGQPALDAVEVRLTATAAGGARGSATARARFVPWTAVTAGAAAVIAAALAAGARAAARRRRRRPPRPPRPPQARQARQLPGRPQSRRELLPRPARSEEAAR